MKYHYELIDESDYVRGRLTNSWRIQNRDTHETTLRTSNRILAHNLLDILNERGFDLETAVRVEGKWAEVAA